MKARLIRLLIVFGVRFVIYGLSLVPLSIIIVQPVDHLFTRGLLIILSFLLVPLLVIIITGLVGSFIRPLPPGRYQLSSPDFFRWFIRDIILDIVQISGFLLNIANRVEFLKYFYYYITGSKSIHNVILTPDVKILDSSKFTFKKNVFIGSGSLLSAHIIKNGCLVIAQSVLKDNVRLGAHCKVSIGATISEGTSLGFGVIIGSNCSLGKKVIIHDCCIIDDYVVIGDGSIIGKHTLVGRKTVIGEHCIIGNYTQISSFQKIPDGARLPDMSIVKNNAENS